MATIAADGTVLDTWFPTPELSADDDGAVTGTNRLSVAEVTDDLAALASRDGDRDVETVVVRTTIASLDDKPADAFDAYLRLHLLSHRLIAPHDANMDGVFGVLANVVTRIQYDIRSLAGDARYGAMVAPINAVASGDNFRTELVRMELNADGSENLLTAELVADTFEYTGVVESANALSPGVPPRVAAQELGARALGAVLVVGHEPGISALGAFFTSRPSFPPFRKGQVCLIDGGQPVWSMHPHTLVIERLLLP